MVELTEVMRQREDLQFIQVLKKSAKKIVIRKLKSFQSQDFSSNQVISFPIMRYMYLQKMHL